MSKVMRMCVMVVSLMSLFGVMSSSAGAVTWVNDGGHAFTATAGPVTLSGNGLSLSCTSATATGTMSTSPFVGSIWRAAEGTATFNGCVVAGVPMGNHCTFTLTALAQTLPVTNGSLDVTCRMYSGATNICHIQGSTPVHYVNPPHARLILTHSNTLVTTNAVGNCPLGNGTAVTRSQQQFTLTSANAPSITRLP